MHELIVHSDSAGIRDYTFQKLCDIFRFHSGDAEVSGSTIHMLRLLSSSNLAVVLRSAVCAGDGQRLIEMVSDTLEPVHQIIGDKDAVSSIFAAKLLDPFYPS